MDSMLAAARAGIVVKKTDIVAKVAVSPGRYSIGNSELSVEWGWIHPCWGLSSRDDYSRWDDDGPLNDPSYIWRDRQERARRLILEHFGLESLADQLSAAVIATIPPSMLFAMRRRLEQRLGLAQKDDMISDRGGDHCSAEHCG